MTNKERCQKWHDANRGKIRDYNQKKKLKHQAYWAAHDAYHETVEQRCCRCQSTLPGTSFYKDSSRKKGLGARCKDCEYFKNQAGAVQRMLGKAKIRALAKGLEFSLKPEDIRIPQVCPVLGIPLFYAKAGGSIRTNPNSPSLDRKDNVKGYTLENVRIISSRANCLKSDASAEELEAIIRYIRS